MFKNEDAVSVDTTDYDLVPPGTVSKSPGVVLAVMDGPQPSYYVRVWLPLGATMDMTVSPNKVGAP